MSVYVNSFLRYTVVFNIKNTLKIFILYNVLIYKYMKKFLVLFIVFIISNSCVNSRMPISRSLLIGTWAVIDDNYKDISEKWDFTDSTLIQISYYKGIDKPIILRKMYYLCSEIPLRYDPSLVGKAKSGTYIAYYSKKQEVIKNYEFISLKNDILTLRYYHEMAVGCEAGYGTLILRRISQ